MQEAIAIRLDGRLGDFCLQVDLSLPMHGISVLFGPSGCGKTTILRCIAGLQHIPGRIAIGGEIWQDEDSFVPTHRRALGYVFQEASLFPHLSVRQNLAYGQKRAGSVQSVIGFDGIVSLLGLGHLVDRMPQHLSGGERQRVAIGRALLSQPRLLLMDEPLSALDRMAKEELLPFLEALHADLEIPILLVTHDMSEVERLADHVMLLRQGKVLGSGPLSLLQADPDLPLATWREAAVTLEARVRSHDVFYGLAELEVEGGVFIVPLHEAKIGARQRLTISAGDVSLAREEPRATTMLNVLPARILSASITGHEVTALLGLGAEGAGSRILARVTRRSWDHLELRQGEAIHAQVKSIALVRGRSRDASAGAFMPPEPG